MTTRRTLLTAGFAAALCTGSSVPAFASDRLLEDILYGISDALVREYVRKHYREGEWDGRYWYRDGRRFTPEEYGRYFRDEYEREHRQPPKQRPQPQPQPRPAQPPRPAQQHPAQHGPSGGPRPNGGQGPAKRAEPGKNDQHRGPGQGEGPRR